MSPITETVNYRLALLCRKHRNVVAAILDAHDLYPGQELILAELWKEDGVTQSHLADRVGIDLSTLTKAVQRLARHGIIHREPDPQDARAVHVFLTPQGRALEPILTAEWNELERQTLQDVTPAERLILATLFERLTTNLP